MTKEMIVSSNGFEKRIAVLEDGVLTEYYVERVDDKSEVMVGNIYKGRVTKVLPGMQSAFVAIGLERDAFLYVADVLEGEEVEYEAPKRESKRASSTSRKGERVEKTGRSEQVAEGDVDEILHSITQAEAARPPGGRGDSASFDQRDYDEQVTELIETISQELVGVSLEAEPGTGADEVDLKDAIIEGKLIEAVQQEEMNEEWASGGSAGQELRVGSLDIRFSSDTELERIIDEPTLKPEADRLGSTEEGASDEAPTGEAPSDQTKETGAPASAREAPAEPAGRDASPSDVADETESSQTDQAPAEPVEMAAGSANQEESSASSQARQTAADADPSAAAEADAVEALGSASEEATASPQEPEQEGWSQEPADATSSANVESESQSQVPAEIVPEPPLEDARAAVRQKSSKAKFAIRRKRRRRPERTRSNGGNGGSSSENGASAAPTITELLQEGQELLVQIAKEPIGNKGARVTSHIALPGRYLVYLPTCEHVGVSRRIPSHTERTRLRRLAARLRSHQKIAGGFIVRTAAESCSEADLLSDLKYLVRVWDDIRHRSEKVKSPALLYREVDVVERILRDRLSNDFAAIRVDNEEEYTKAVNFVAHFQPELVNRVKLHTRETPIFEQYGIQSEIDKTIRQRVWLKSGGYIVINQTEALVAIDVNTGKFVGKTNRFEDTITRTNIEASKEIARQVRLRDLGGIIVLDFIDMEERKNRQKVMQVLEEELRKDRAPAKVLSFNDFGLVAITRKRVRQSLERTLCEPCSYCQGSGMIKSPQTVCYEIFDEVRRIAVGSDNVKEVILRAHPVVAQALRERYPRLLEEIEAYFSGKLTLETDQRLHQEQFDIALV